MKLPLDIARKIDGRNIIVFDGVCVLCNGWVKFVLRFDRQKRFHFVVAQSEFGEAIYESLHLKSDDYETFIVVSHGRISTKLDGVFALFYTLGWPWRLLSVGRFLPQFLKNASYSLIARNRYRLFGRKDICMVPTPDVKARFID